MIFCPVCDSEKVRTVESHCSRTGESYELMACPVCETYFWEPRHVAAAYYENEDRTSAAYMLMHSGMRRTQYWHAPFLNNFARRKGALLDVGCGEGSFLVRAKNLGFDVYGIDFDAKSMQAARRRLGNNKVYDMPLEEFVQYAQKRELLFDVITFFEVLEHQEDPCKFLRNIKGILKPGGWIAGSTPNRDRFFADVERRAGDGDFPPHHFFWFSRDSLHHLLSHSGFAPDVSFIRGTTERMADVLQVILAGPFLRNIRSRMFTHIAERAESKKSSHETKENLAKAYILLKRMSLLPFYPLAVFLVRVISGREPNLYFEGQRVD